MRRKKAVVTRAIQEAFDLDRAGPYAAIPPRLLAIHPRGRRPEFDGYDEERGWLTAFYAGRDDASFESLLRRVPISLIDPSVAIHLLPHMMLLDPGERDQDLGLGVVECGLCGLPLNRIAQVLSPNQIQAAGLYVKYHAITDLTDHWELQWKEFCRRSR